ncbi:transketolase C-terminal domain-containing protein, partial [Chloroflexota bacterium]
ATVVNARFAKPLDSELLIGIASRIKRIVTVEENTLNGGFGSSVSVLLQRSGLYDIQVKSIGLPDVFIEQGTQDAIRSSYGLDAKGIARQVSALFTKLDSNTLPVAEGKAEAGPIK